MIYLAVSATSVVSWFFSCKISTVSQFSPAMTHSSPCNYQITEDTCVDFDLHRWVYIETFCLSPGWLRVRPAHLSSLRSVLSRGPEAVLSGGFRNRRRDLHPGNSSSAAEVLACHLHKVRRLAWPLLFFFIIFQALSTESIERLPVYNKSAWKHYKTIHEADDWCVPSKEPKDMTTFRSF